MLQSFIQRLKIVTFSFLSGEKWKQDVEMFTRSNGIFFLIGGFFSRLLRDHLAKRYPGVYWVVAAFDHKSGWASVWTVGNGYSLVNRFGNTIMVGQIKTPRLSTSNPDINTLFWRVYAPKMKIVKMCPLSGFCWLSKIYESEIDPKPTVDATWGNMISHKLSPAFALVVQGGKSWEWATHGAGNQAICNKIQDSGLACIMIK